MAGSVRIYSRWECDPSGGRPYAGGLMPHEAPRVIAGDGRIFDNRVSVAASSTAELYDASKDLSDFDFLSIETDLNVIIQFVIDDNNGVGERVGTLGLLGSGTAGTFGPCFELHRDDGYANYTVDFAGGTLDFIERITAKNLDATAAATVRLFAFT